MAQTTKAHQRYKTKAGIIVPGVTTILNLKNKPFLVPWAWKLGMQGIDYRKVTDKAADIGTVAHYFVECFLRKQQADQEYIDEFSTANIKVAQFAYQQFEEIWKQLDLETFPVVDKNGETVMSAEVQLVSEDWLFGGTIDNMARRKGDGTYWLGDVKTSSGVYDEHWLQMAAYWHMWEENYPEMPIRGVNIFHLDKATGKVALHKRTDLDNEWEIFQHLRAIYHLEKRTDRNRNNDRKVRFRQVQ